MDYKSLDTVSPTNAEVVPTYSVGISANPNIGWDCGLPPCVCCKDPVYFSDNRKSWSETGQYNRSCCSKNWSIEDVRVQPSGTPYFYATYYPCCPCTEAYMTVSRQGMEVGRVTQKCAFCTCGEVTLLEASGPGANQPAKYTLRTGGCCNTNSCCAAGCCPRSPGCCDTWVRWDSWFYSGPHNRPRDEYVGKLTTQTHRCCPAMPCCPWWMGFDSLSPAMSEDDRALMLAMALFSPPAVGRIMSDVPPEAVMQ